MRDTPKGLMAIEGYPGYFSSRDGHFWSSPKGTSNPRGKWQKESIHHGSYLVISVVKNGKKFQLRAHRAVALAWIPNPGNLPQINHKNGVKTDNRVVNLEWCTASQNKLHAHRVLGIKNVCGSAHKNSKLDENKVREIRSQFGKLSFKQLGLKYKVSWSSIRNISVGKTWAHI